MHADSLQEELLHQQLQNGDEQALFSIMLFYYNDLFKYSLKITADADLSKEYVNQFFIYAWQNRKNFLIAEKIKPYLIVAFKRYLFYCLRSKSRNTHKDSVPANLYEQPYEEYIIALQKEEQTKKLLEKAIRSLSKRQRQLVVLRYYDQLSYEQISETTSLSIRTVYNKLHAAIKKLRKNNTLQQIKDL